MFKWLGATFTFLHRSAKKNNITFVINLILVCSSIVNYITPTFLNTFWLGRPHNVLILSLVLDLWSISCIMTSFHQTPTGFRGRILFGFCRWGLNVIRNGGGRFDLDCAETWAFCDLRLTVSLKDTNRWGKRVAGVLCVSGGISSFSVLVA